MTALIQDWFRVERAAPGVYLIEEPLHVERVKSYLIVGSDRALLLDTGMGVADMPTLVAALSDRPLVVVNSHAHWDHVGGTAAFARQAEIWIHEAEAASLAAGIANPRLRGFLAPPKLLGPLPPGFDPETAVFPPVRVDRLLHGGERFELGGRTLEVLHLPGHSPGLVALLDRANGLLFSTDVAYAGALYAQFADSDLTAYQTTMEQLANLAPSLRTVFPAHNESPIDPAILPRMRDALNDVADDRRPDRIDGAVAAHEFGAFSVLVAADRRASECR